MATEVSISLFGDKVFKRKILAVRYRAKNMSPVLGRIADQWLDIIEEQFTTEGARGGNPWTKLSRETKLRRGSAHPILVETGDLLIEMTDPGSVKVTDDEIRMELPRDVVARSHQHGFFNTRAGRSVPARPMVAFTEADRLKWRGSITDYLVNGRL
jgi:phage gpG-like protein